MSSRWSARNCSSLVMQPPCKGTQVTPTPWLESGQGGRGRLVWHVSASLRDDWGLEGSHPAFQFPTGPVGDLGAAGGHTTMSRGSCLPPELCGTLGRPHSCPTANADHALLPQPIHLGPPLWGAWMAGPSVCLSWSLGAHLHLVDVGGVGPLATVSHHGLAAAVRHPAALGLPRQDVGTMLPVG